VFNFICSSLVRKKKKKIKKKKKKKKTALSGSVMKDLVYITV